MLAKQVVDGVETRFVRDTNFNVLQERDSNNNAARSYVWDEVSPGGIGGLLELTQNGQHYNYLYDGKGNVSALIDASQQVVESYKYDSFGKLISKSGTVDQPYMFSTKPYYEGYGKSYYEYRFYDPTCGKWMTRDPRGEGADINLYRVVGNDSVNFIDPYGLYTWPYTPVGWAGAIVSSVGFALLAPGVAVATPVAIGVIAAGGLIQVYDLLTMPSTVKNAAEDLANKSVRPYFNNHTCITNHIDQ